MARSRFSNDNPLSLFSFQDIITSVTGIMVLITLLLAVELSQRRPIEPAQDTSNITSQLQNELSDLQKQIQALKLEYQNQQQQLSQVAGISAEKLEAQRKELEMSQSTLETELQKLEQQQSKQQSELRRLQAKNPDHLAKQQEHERIRKQLEQDQAKLEELKNSRRIIFRSGNSNGKPVWLLDVREQVCLAAPLNQQNSIQTFQANDTTELVSKLTTWLLSDASMKQAHLVLMIRPNGIKAADKMQILLRKQGISYGFDLLPADVPFLPGTK
jgi:DNA repair exonuclease SbcCD ATPase subunit